MFNPESDCRSTNDRYQQWPNPNGGRNSSWNHKRGGRFNMHFSNANNHTSSHSLNTSNRNHENVSLHDRSPTIIGQPVVYGSQNRSFTRQPDRNARPNDKPFTVVGPSDGNGSQKDRPFTVITPSNRSATTRNGRPFTIEKPAEPCDFTIVTDVNNDFDQFDVAEQELSYSSRNIFGKISMKASNYFAFSSQTSADILKMSFLYAVARFIYECETDEALIPAIAAAEYAADYLPRNQRLFGCEADDYFKRVMAKAVRDPNFILKVHPNEQLYETLEDFGLPRFYPTPEPVPLKGEQYMRILQILSTSLDPVYANSDLIVSLTALAPCLQLDNVTFSFLGRLQKTVLEELHKNIRLDIRSTHVFYDQYLREASEQEVEEMVVYLRLTIPESAKRLRALLKRLPGNGLLPITLIGRALAECDDFPWGKTLELYPDDWKAAGNAIRQINNDPFYGYRRDKSDEVHPRHYQNLAWLGRQLCVKKLKDDYPDINLWIGEPSHAEEAKRLVALYVARTSHPEGDAMAVDDT